MGCGTVKKVRTEKAKIMTGLKTLCGGGTFISGRGGHAPKWEHSLHQRGEARIKKNIQMRQERVIDDHNCDYKA